MTTVDNLGIPLVISAYMSLAAIGVSIFSIIYAIKKK